MQNAECKMREPGEYMASENIILEKSFGLAVRIVNFYKYLSSEKKEYVLSKQLLRSGTSIGANIHEAQHGQSKADFATKMNIALKEANEAMYWIKLLYKTEYITETEYTSIESDVSEIKYLLISICKTSFAN